MSVHSPGSCPRLRGSGTCPGAHPGASSPHLRLRTRAGSGPLPSRPPSGLPARPPGPHSGQQSRPAEVSLLLARVVWAVGRTNTFMPLPGQNSSLSGSREGRSDSMVCTQGGHASSLPPDEVATLLPRPQQQGGCLPLPSTSLSSLEELGLGQKW